MARILLIDDDDTIRAVLGEVLAQSGHTVIEARDGTEGLELFTHAAPDLVITDMVMPRKNGLEVVRVLRERQPELKIIAMSAGGRNGARDHLQTARLLGADGVLAKPFSFVAFLGAINEALGPGASRQVDG